MEQYTRKSKGEIAKALLKWIALAGVIAIAATSPYFLVGLLRAWGESGKYKRKSIETTLYRLRKHGLIVVQKKRGAYALFLSEKGKRHQALLQLLGREIPRPQRWDGQWRLLMFDVKQRERWKRDALRRFLRRMGFVQFQKSIWVHPYDCSKEVDSLRALLEFVPSEMKLVTAHDVGKDASVLMRRFKLA